LIVPEIASLVFAILTKTISSVFRDIPKKPVLVTRSLTSGCSYSAIAAALLEIGFAASDVFGGLGYVHRVLLCSFMPFEQLLREYIIIALAVSSSASPIALIKLR